MCQHGMCSHDSVFLASYQSKFYEGTLLPQHSWKNQVVDYTDANLRTSCTFTVIMKAGIECRVCNRDEFCKTALDRFPPTSERPNKGCNMMLALAIIDWHKRNALKWNLRRTFHVLSREYSHIYPQSFGKFQFFTWAKQSGFFMAASAACKQILWNVLTLRLWTNVSCRLCSVISFEPSFSFHLCYVYFVARQQNPCKVFQSATTSLVCANISHSSVSGKFFCSVHRLIRKHITA